MNETAFDDGVYFATGPKRRTANVAMFRAFLTLCILKFKHGLRANIPQRPLHPWLAHFVSKSSRRRQNMRRKAKQPAAVRETSPRSSPTVPSRDNLVPRVLWLFGQRMGASRDSGIMEFLIPENVGIRSLCACLTLKRK